MKSSFLILFFLIPFMAFTQDSQELQKDLVVTNINALKIQEKIILDGRLDEEAWSRAVPISGFKQVDPEEGELAVFDSEVRIVYGDRHLFIGAYLKDTTGRKGLRTPNLKRDFDFNENDLFGLAIDAFNDQTNAVAFQVTPFGTQRDLQIVNGVIQDVDWDAIWKSETTITSKGWYAEIAIPFNSIKYPANPEEGKPITWRINFVRIHRRSNEISAFPGYPRSQSPYRMTYAIDLRNLYIRTSGENFRINPYVLQQAYRNDSSPTTWSTKFGGDFRWNVAPNANLDITLNTDFAQTDIDKEVINLSRFSIHLPEKREFFLEGAGLFVTGDQHLKPFFSRRIGLESTGDPIPLIGGAKFISRSSSRSLGAMYVLQDASESLNRRHFGVWRIQQNLGSSNNVGLLLSSMYEEGKKQNHVLSLDGTRQFSEKWRLSYMWSNSLSVDKTDKAIGSAANANFSYLSNDFIFISNHTLISEQYNPETGFVSNRDMIDHAVFAFPVIRTKWFPSFIRSYKPGVGLNLTTQVQKLEFRTGRFNFSPVYFSLDNGGLFYLNFKRYWQTLRSEFKIPGSSVGPGEYSYNRSKAFFSSDQSRKLAVSTSYEWGGFYNGNLSKIKAGFTYAPIPNVYFENHYEYNDFKGFKASDEKMDSHLFSSSLRLAVNRKLQLNASYQYNSALDRGHLNTRLSWQFAPLSYIHLIFDTQRKNSSENEQRAMLKINLMKNF